MKELTIIIPVYNCQEYLSDCLKSVIKCPFTEMECILVNDGSTDQSLMICEEYKKKDSRIRIINQKNQGVSAARNQGMKEAIGTYIMFLDADDYIDSKIWDTLGQDLREKKHDFIAYSYYILYESGKIHMDQFSESLDKRSQKFYIDSLMYASSRLNTCWGKLFLKSVIDQYQLTFPTELKIGEDFLFVASYYQMCKHPILKKEAILYYRQHGSSAMRKYTMEERINFLHILYEFNKRIVQKEKNQSLMTQMNYYYLCAVTDLFLEYAKVQPITLLRKNYKKSLNHDTVVEIISHVMMHNVAKSYKKVELFLLKRHCTFMLSCYFKLKSYADKRR